MSFERSLFFFDSAIKEVGMVIEISGASRLLKLKVFRKEEWIEIPVTEYLGERLKWVLLFTK